MHDLQEVKELLVKRGGREGYMNYIEFSRWMGAGSCKNLRLVGGERSSGRVISKGANDGLKSYQDFNRT